MASQFHGSLPRQHLLGAAALEDLSCIAANLLGNLGKGTSFTAAVKFECRTDDAPCIGDEIGDDPQDTIERPTTIYGITRVAVELLCDYYFRKYRLDVRGVRYPGVISSETKPGGGTTDYAVEMFYAAIEQRPYICFVHENTVLPMIYMPDCVRAAVDLMEADLCHLRHHYSFNVTSMSFSAGELAAEIKRHVPGFTCTYAPVNRQAIADSWPRSLDDSAARREWNWRPEYDLANLTRDMLERLRVKQLCREP